MDPFFQIAIDGPSAAGKSTIAKEVAKSLSIEYIDTGAMYRAVAYQMLKMGILLENEKELKEMLEKIHIDFSGGKTLLNGEDISALIRTSRISKLASDVSAQKEVREKLVALQREMGRAKSVVMDGRDIGTNVFPLAGYKFFLTASLEERARRRWADLIEKDPSVSLDEVKEDIAARDHNDRTRALNPLRKAADALEIDTTELSVDEVTDRILVLINQTGV